MNQHWLFLLTQSPTQTALANESLDAVVTAALFDQKVDVVFMNEGCEWVQSPDNDKLDLLGSMDNCTLYTLASLTDNNRPEQLNQSIFKTLSTDELKHKMSACDKILSF